MVCCQVMGNDVAVDIGGSNGQLRAQRLQAGDHPQRPAVDPPAGRRLPQLQRQLRRRHRGRPRADRASCCTRALMLVTALNPHDRLRQRRQDREEGAQGGHHAQGGRDRARAADRRAVRPVGPAGVDARAFGLGQRRAGRDHGVRRRRRFRACCRRRLGFRLGPHRLQPAGRSQEAPSGRLGVVGRRGRELDRDVRHPVQEVETGLDGAPGARDLDREPGRRALGDAARDREGAVQERDGREDVPGRPPPAPGRCRRAGAARPRPRGCRRSPAGWRRCRSGGRRAPPSP